MFWVYVKSYRTLFQVTLFTARALLGQEAGALADEDEARDASSAGTTAPSPDAEAPKRLTRAPKLTKFVPAAFPEAEKQHRSSAAVVLELLISSSGGVVDARVIGSAGAAFDEAALTAARGFEFEPALIDDQPAAVKIQYRYEFTLQEVHAAPTVLRGEVFIRGEGRAMAGVTLRLDTGQEAVTDAQGRFVFEGVTPGVHSVLLSGRGISALQTSETLREAGTLEVRYEVGLVRQNVAPGEAVAIDDLELVIVAPKLAYQVVATRVDASNARRVAGTQGDVLKVVENMPGVARASAGSGDVVVWGAAPLDTRVYVDSVRVPALYHFGGLRSVVHTDLVRSVELIPGAYGAAYGRGLGGIVTVDTIDPAKEHLKGSVQLDLLDASVALHGPLSDKFFVSGALRRSHLQDLTSSSAFDRTREYYLIPSYADASLRVRYQAEPASFFEVGALGSRDQSTRRAGGDDPIAQRSETRKLGFGRIFARYERQPGDGSRVSVVPWVGQDRQSLDGRFGKTPVLHQVNSLVSGLRADWTGSVLPHTQARLGLDLDAVQSRVTRVGSISAPPREGDARVFGQPPADQINADTWEATTASAAPYLEADVAFFADRLHVVPGLRVEPFFVSVGRRRPAEGSATDVGAFSADLSLQPRLSLRYALTAELQLKAAAGRYRQPPLAEDLSAVFGNPLLTGADANHVLVGAVLNSSKVTSIEVTAFASESHHLAVRNPIASPRVAEALVAIGEGRSRGLQVLFKRELSNRFFGWVAYTLLRSERKDAPDRDWRPFDYDQTHVFTALGSYDLGRGFEVGARARVATGYPRTPVEGAYFDSRRDQFEPVLGALNSSRLPTFWQLDVRVAKDLKLGATDLEIYLDVQNVTNRANPEEIVYNANYSDKEFIRGLPVLPVLGARWSF